MGHPLIAVVVKVKVKMKAVVIVTMKTNYHAALVSGSLKQDKTT